MRRGYLFVTDTCHQLGSEAFRTRLLGRNVVCARGSSAAHAFYRTGRFTRAGAMPSSVVHLLQDKASVQALDGPEHRHRKGLFLTVVPQGDAHDLVAAFRESWGRAAARWDSRARVVLLDELAEVLTRTATQWAGIRLSDRDVVARTRELPLMISGAGGIGPQHWRARALRRRCERWAVGCVQQAREGEGSGPATSPLRQIATHRDPDGRPLLPEVAAVELLNLLRPIVAVGRFMVFCADALARHPHWSERFRDGDETDLWGFVQEVRRLYPFFPLIAGRALEPFRWSGHDFAVGDRMILDLYGTNHDARLWPAPEEFRPERFRGWKGDSMTLVPQGGGEVTSGHRCPGENATIALMAESVRLLTRTLEFTVPPQDLSIDLRRMPTQPRDGFVIERPRVVAGGPGEC